MYLNKAKFANASDMLQTLIGLRTDDPDLNIIVRGDSQTKYRQIRAVLDVCQQANVAKVDLATEALKKYEEGRKQKESAPASAARPLLSAFRLLPSALAYAAANPAAQKAQLVEGEPAHLVRLSRAHRADAALFRRAPGIAGQTNPENFGGDGQGKAAGKTQGTPEKPKVEPPKVEQPKVAAAPKIEPPKEVADPHGGPARPSRRRRPNCHPLTSTAARRWNTSSDPVQLYKSSVEYALRSKWDRPDNVDDDKLRCRGGNRGGPQGRIGNPVWEKSSGNDVWDDSVRRALAAVTHMDRPPPTNFPSHVVVRFDVQEETEPVLQ